MKPDRRQSRFAYIRKAGGQHISFWRIAMKKNLGIVQAVYPMPVLMVAAYDENGKVNVMNAA